MSIFDDINTGIDQVAAQKPKEKTPEELAAEQKATADKKKANNYHPDFVGFADKNKGNEEA